ncbi:Outer membrane protein B [Pontiella desulfatans]|uniref:Outer membrane protein B n=1 Tax=Pontiella desulfatans TaxID=2750659 RepID=A0A6C2U7W2_PONDE|nr:autotransporter outer membrane beta-barrel domain-containing protein [Pontiella desulfatans]VGO15514.1 Outer membrane protein B [Pontiella desulfatans]
MNCTFKHGRTALLLMAVSLCATYAVAIPNPIDGGTSYTNSTDDASTGPLYVGYFDPDNTLTVNNDSTLAIEKLIIGKGKDSSNNVVSVVGDARLVAGNADTNGLSTGGIIVGDADGDAAISINYASKLDGEYLYVGLGTNDSGKIELAGEGSALSIASNAFVGVAGSTNTVNIGSGATLEVGGMLTVGQSGSNNYVNVSGTLSVNSTNDINVVDTEKDNGVAVKNGGTLQVDGAVDTGTLEDLGIDMQSRSTLELGGELTLGGNKIDDSYGIVLDGDTATWQSDALTLIGESSSYNILTFTNGATGTASNYVVLGQNYDAENDEKKANYNELNVGGTGSTFTAQTRLTVGDEGKYNELNIADGGMVDAQSDLYVGANETATGNSVNVGSNGTLNATGNVIVGANGGSNQFNIDHGTVVAESDFILGRDSSKNTYNQTGGTNTVAGEFIIGKNAGATGASNNGGNTATVGEAATLNLQSDLVVGLEGGGSILNISDGGLVNLDGNAIIGEAVGDNYIFLTPDNADSRFNVASNLVVGKSDDGNNRFSIYGGTTEVAGNLYVGATTNQHTEKNYIHLETTNAVLNVANAIHIGAENSINTFDIVMGAEANTKDLLVGAYEGTSNNMVTIRGENNYNDYVDGSLLTVSNSLVIGSDTGSGNAVNIEEGGTLYVSAQDNIEIKGTNNTLTVSEGGTLKSTDWNLSATANGLTNIFIESGATLHLLGTLSGTNTLDGGYAVLLDGAGASWEGTDLFIDNQSTLSITNEAVATATQNLYIGLDTDNNAVTVGGAGSLLDIGMDLFIGTESNNSYQNTLTILDGASVMVGKDAYVYHNSTLKIDGTSTAKVEGDYNQDEYSTLEVGISTNNTEANLQVAGKANLESGSTIRVVNNGVGKNDTNLVQNVVVAGELTINDEAASTGSLLDNINIDSSLLFDFNTVVSNGNTIVLDNFIVRTIGEVGGLEGQLKDVATEINEMFIAGNSNATAMVEIIANMSSSAEINAAMDAYYGEKKSSTPAHNVVNMGLQSVAEQVTKRADNTRARMGEASARISWDKPKGVAGPHMQGQQLQGWISGYGNWGDKDAADGFDGYSADISGFLIGADLSVGENVLFGLAGGAGNGTADRGAGATTDTKSMYAAFYTSIGTKDWFGDAGIIYGTSDIDSTYGTTFDTKADYSADNVAFFLGGGKEMSGKYLIYTPQLSFLGNYYSQEGYEEQSSDAVQRSVDSFDAFYLQSSLGCSMGMYMGMGSITIKPEIRAYWQHEWLGDDENVGYTLVDGYNNNYTMILQAPEKDILKIGIGASAKLGEFLELRADLDSRRGKDYSDYTLLGSMRYQF